MNKSEYYIEKVLTIWILLMATFCHGQYISSPVLTGKQIVALTDFANGSLFYGTKTGEIGTYDGLIFNKKGLVDGASINRFVKKKGQIWICTTKGLYRYKNGFLKTNFGTHLNILDFDPEKNIAITSQGVYHYNRNEFTPDKEDFYNVSEVRKGNFIHGVNKDCIRINNSIYQFDGHWKEVIVKRHDNFVPLPLNKDAILLIDSNSVVKYHIGGYVDSLLTFPEKTLTKADRIDYNEYLIYRHDQIMLFDTRNNTQNVIYNASTENISASVKDKWGNYWIAAGSYLYKIISTKNSNAKASPELELLSININGKDVSATEKPIKLKAENNDIALTYKAHQLSYPQDIEYQYRIISNLSNEYRSNTLPSGWSAYATDGRVIYRDLKAGEYEISVRATIDRNYYTYSDPIPIKVSDNTIFYLWLIGIFSVLSVLGLALFFNYRYQKLKIKGQDERKLLKQENEFLALQQKALQLQMNPHFVFNSLNSIQGLIAQEKNKDARKYLRSFSQMMRSVLNQSRKDYILLSEEIDYLKHYIELEQMANNQSFDFSIQGIEGDDEIKIPTMIIQPFIENAIIHGVKNKEDGRGQIDIVFEKKGNNIICEITDNGIGRVAAMKLKQSGHESIAIDVASARLKSTANQQKIKYEDLMEGQVAKGTKVTLIIPMAYAH